MRSGVTPADGKRGTGRTPADGKYGNGRKDSHSCSGDTQARPEATGLMTEIYELVLYLNEKSFKSQRVQENLSKGVYV